MADFYVTPGGSVAAVFPGLTDADASSLQCAAAVLQTWTHEQLDDISTDYFYETEGQGALVVDVMARLGFMGYAGKVPFYAAVDKTLSCGDFFAGRRGFVLIPCPSFPAPIHRPILQKRRPRPR